MAVTDEDQHRAGRLLEGLLCPPPLLTEVSPESLLGSETVEPLRLAVPSDHQLAQAIEVRLADAADDRFVMVRPSSLLRQACNDLCRAAGFQPVVSFEGDDRSTVLGFVAVGLGVAIVPAASEGSPGPGTAPIRYLRITDVPATREIGLAWAADGRLLPAAELFREHVIDRVRQRRLPAVHH